MVILYGLAFLFHASILEFICAQAPSVLSGMLVGLMYSVSTTAFGLGVRVFAAWSLVYQEHTDSPSCGVWLTLFATITAILGCVLWCAVAKWYKRRERDEPDVLDLC